MYRLIRAAHRIGTPAHTRMQYAARLRHCLTVAVPATAIIMLSPVTSIAATDRSPLVVVSTAQTDTVDIVSRLAPAWRRWIRRGGAVCLAWNTRRASRTDMLVAMADAGFELPDGWDFDGMVGSEQSMGHTVDSTISRDVLVVVKP